MDIIFKGTLVFLVTIILSLGITNNNKIQFIKHEYKQSFELATDAAMDCLPYSNDFDLENNSETSINYDTDKSLSVFYSILEGNLTTTHVEHLKSYIPIKIFITNNNLVIYDRADNKEIVYYDVSYNGSNYRLTLDDKSVYPFDKKQMLSNFINGIINREINENKLGNVYYNLKLNENNDFYNQIDSVGFIVFSEGIPIPSLLPNQNKLYYINSIAGDQVIRDDKDY